MPAPTYHSFERSTYTVGSSTTCNKPTGTVAGDLLLAFVISESNPGYSAPSGWTDESGSNQETGYDAQMRLYSKIAGGSEPSDYTWSASPAFNDMRQVCIVRVSGQASSGYIHQDVYNKVFSTSYTHSNLTTTVDNCLYFLFASPSTDQGGSITASPSMTNIVFNGGIALGYNVQTTAGILPSETWTTNYANIGGCRVAIAPAADVKAPPPRFGRRSTRFFSIAG